MQEKKLLYGAIIFSLILISTGFFITQIGNVFSKAAGTITGTIVLSDEIKYESTISPGTSLTFPISLPGTSCNVKFTACGNGDGSYHQISVLGITTLTETSYEQCKILTGTLTSNIYEYRIKVGVSSGIAAVTYAAVAYSCT